MERSVLKEELVNFIAEVLCVAVERVGTASTIACEGFSGTQLQPASDRSQERSSILGSGRRSAVCHGRSGTSPRAYASRNRTWPEASAG